MDSIQIKYFLQVAKDLNFTKASEHLFVSQSAVSKKISSLEKELGFSLFVRTHQFVRLNENGKRFVEFFERVNKEFDDECNIAKYHMCIENKIIRIGVIEGYDLSEMFNRFNDECSFNDFKVSFDKIDALLNGLSAHDYDIIIGQYKGIQQSIKKENLLSDIECVHLFNTQRAVVFSKNNKLYKKENLSINDFKDQYFFIGKSLVALQNAKEICEKENINPTLMPILNFATIEYELSKGNGFALGDRFSKILKNRDYAYIWINHHQMIGCAYRKDADSRKLKYIKEVIKVFKNS